jgi:hypothetical protein
MKEGDDYYQFYISSLFEEKNQRSSESSHINSIDIGGMFINSQFTFEITLK